MMADAVPELSETDQAHLEEICDCLTACVKSAARAHKLAFEHRLFPDSALVREASREAHTAQYACERALQLLAVARDSRGVRPSEPEDKTR